MSCIQRCWQAAGSIAMAESLSCSGSLQSSEACKYQCGILSLLFFNPLTQEDSTFPNPAFKSNRAMLTWPDHFPGSSTRFTARHGYPLQHRPDPCVRVYGPLHRSDLASQYSVKPFLFALGSAV